MAKRTTGILLLSLLMGAAYPVAVVLLGPPIPLVEALRMYAIGTVYSLCIGVPAQFLMPFAGAKVSRYRAPWSWLALLTVLLALAFLGTFTACGILVLAGLFPRDYLGFAFAVGLRISVVLTLVFGITGYLFSTLRSRLERTTLQLRTQQLESERSLKLASEARLSSLESRIHPHFLFNTINSISALIREDPRRAERMLEQMAALLRFSLDSHRSLVPLAQELKIANDYLEIEKARFGDRLRYSMELAAGLNGQSIPPLAVQSLLENCVKYAVSTRREGATLRVRVWRENGRVMIEVWDDGPGFTSADIQPGHGLDNIASRLESCFPGQAFLSVAPGDGGTEVLLSLPAVEC